MAFNGGLSCTPAEKAQARLHLALELTGLGTWEFDLATGILSVDQRTSAIFGLEPSGALDWTARVHAEDGERVTRELGEAITLGVPFRSEHRILRPDQSIRWLDASALPVRDQGRIVQLAGVVQDVTSRHERESLIRRSHEIEAERQLLESIIQNAPVAMSIVRAPDFVYEVINPAFQALAPGKKMLGEKFADVWAEVQDPLVPILENIIATGEMFQAIDTPYLVKKRPGEAPEELRVTYSWIPLCAAGGRPDRILTVAVDTTARNQAEAALRKSESEHRHHRQFLETLLVAAPYCIAVLKGLELRYTLVNPAYQAIAGPDVQLVGKTYAEAFPEAAAEGAEAHLRRVIETGEPWTVQGYRGATTRNPDAVWEGMVVRLPYQPDEEPSLLSIVWEVTEREKLQQAVRDREAMLDAFFVASPEILNLFDDELRILNSDAVSPTYVGLDRTSIIGRSVKDLNPVLAEQHLIPIHRRVTETGRPETGLEISGPVPGRPGETAWFRASYFPVPLPGGRKGLGSIALDITKSKLAEERLIRGEQQLRATVRSIVDEVWIVDVDGRVVLVNEAVQEHLGVAPDHWDNIYAAVADLEIFSAGGTPRPPDRSPLRRALGGERIANEKELVRNLATGELRLREVTSAPVYDSDGRITGAVLVARDITERQRADEALRESETRERVRAAELQAIMDAVPAMMFITRDPECREMTGSGRTYELLGLPQGSNVSKSAPESAAPKTFRIMRNGVEIPAHELPVQRAARTGSPVHDYEFDMVLGNGACRTMLGEAVPLLDENGSPRGAVGAFVDITDRKGGEAELKATAAALRRSNEELEQFAYIVSHDLQEPLRTITSFSSMLSRRMGPSLDADNRELLGFVLSATARMRELINGLLAYSRVEYSSDDIQSVEMNAVVDYAISTLARSIGESQAVVTRDALPGVRGDFGRCVQLVENLIGNALKYRSAESPRIHITGSRTGGECVLSVSDNGIGIAPGYHEQIFGVFRRLHTAAEYPGTGIGLALCKKIVERAGGRIWVESEPGKGSTFRFTLPGGEGS